RRPPQGARGPREGPADRGADERWLRGVVRRTRGPTGDAQLVCGRRHRSEHRQRVRRRRRRESHQPRMKRRVVWLGRALVVLGLTAVIPAVLQANRPAWLAAIGGFVAAPRLAPAPLVRQWLTQQPVSPPSDF